MTRAFRIYNSEGDMIDLLADLDVFGVNPDGLGVAFEHQTHLSNSNFLLEKSELKANIFKISIVFGYVSLDPYAAYSKLIQLLNKPPYRLEYETTVGVFVRECRLTELTKSEITTGDIMMEDFQLECFTPWYKEITSKIDPTEDTPGDGKIYRHYENVPLPTPSDQIDDGYWKPDKVAPYMYDYIYMPKPSPKTQKSMDYYSYDYVYEGWVNGQDGVFKITNNSIYLGAQEGSPMEVTIKGPAINPYWQVIRNAQVLQSDGFKLTVQEGYKLIVNSIPGQQCCKLIAPDGTESNVYQQQRLELSNFVTAPMGRCEVAFFNATKISFKLREEYVVV